MLPREAHLQRAWAATVMLDTLLVNGHTTGMDVTWAGLPLVTVPDSRFASRVGASILSAVGCPLTIARDGSEYVMLGSRIAASERAEDIVRECLGRGRTEGRLFDTERWVRDWERMTRMLWDAHGGFGSQAKYHILTAKGRNQ